MQSVPVLIIGGLAMLLAWAGAVALLAAGARSRVNRRAAVLLAVEGLSAAVIPFFLYQAESAPTPETGSFFGDIFAGLFVFILIVMLGVLLFVGTLLVLVPLYLSLLATLETPLVAPIRTLPRRLLVLLGLAALVGGSLALAPEAGFVAVVAVLLATPAYALAAGVSAWRRAAPGTPDRSRLRALALAFGSRSLAWLALAVGLGVSVAADADGEFGVLLLVVWPVATTVFVALLAYALLPTRTPKGREPRLRRTLRRRGAGGFVLLLGITLVGYVAGELSSAFGWAVGLPATLLGAVVADAMTRKREKVLAEQDAEPATGG